MHRDFRHATPASSCWTMSPILYQRFTAAIHLQSTPPRTRTGDQLGWNQSCCQLHQGRTFSTLTTPCRAPMAIPLPKRVSSPHRYQEAEGEGLEPPSGSRRHLFSRQVPHPAGCLPLANKLRGLESNQGTDRPKAGLVLLVQSQASLPAATTPDRRCLGTRSNPDKLGEKDLNLHLLLQRQAAYH